MPIKFHCPDCNKLLRTPDETAGKQAKCPECGTLIQIPDAPEQAAPPPEASGEPSPFDASAPPPPLDDMPGPENPYESPVADQPFQQGGAMPSGADIAQAQSRVAGPAIALMVTGILGGLLQLAALVMNIAMMGGAAPQGMQAPPGPEGAISVVSGIVALAMAALVTVGAMKMKNLASYNLSMTSAIVAMVPCISPCCLIGLPFGIWALVVLLDGQVQAAFKAAQSSY